MVSLKVPEKEVCSIAKAVWEEFQPCLAKEPPSTSFLRMATRLASTGHENRLTDNLPEHGLSADIPVSYVDCGLSSGHPILAIQDFIQTLDANGKIDLLLMGNRSPIFTDFWANWQQLQPNHEVFSYHQNRLGSCIPISVHFDEGTTLKKKAIMIIQTQAVIGKGTRKRRSTSLIPGCNFVGNTITSRYLWSVMLARLYSKKTKGNAKKNAPLIDLIAHLAKQLRDAFYNGMEVTIDGKLETIFLVPLGCKGDWPALAKVGTLQRHFGRQSAKDGAAGICHLCRADQDGFKNWHDVSFSNIESMHRDVPLPWTRDPALLSAVPLPDAYKASFFKSDLFHTLHKGVFADIAANTIVF